MNFQFAIKPKPAGGYSVSLQVGKDEVVTGDFFFRKDGAAVAADLDDINDGNPSRDCITHVGEELWVALANGNVLQTFEASFLNRDPEDHALIQLAIPVGLRDLPWEALYYRRNGFLCGLSDCAIVHAPDEVAKVADWSVAKSGPPRLLLVIPQRSELNVEPERDSINRAFERLGGGKPGLLDGIVDPEVLHHKLAEGWDIVHFIGHGGVDNQGRVQIKIKKSDGSLQLYDGEEFAASLGLSRARLVVMNCCRSNGGWDRSGLTGFGPLLMRSGIPTVVAMQYAIGNDMAQQFAVTFYEQLFSGRRPGRVDRAVEESRAALRRCAGADDQRAFITPVLHLAPKYENLFEFAPQPPKPDGPDIVVLAHGAGPAGPLPAKLVAALREHRCIPVIGPGVLRAQATRAENGGEPPPFGPRELALQIAANPEHAYPRPADIKLCDSAGDWLSPTLLQWVSQYAESQDDSRGDLLEEIQRQYVPTAMPPLIRKIARWKVPELFYTHFDGYLESCVVNGEGWLDNVVYELEKPPTVPTAREFGPRSLVLVRGCHTKAEQFPLILTEDDHDKLAERITKLDDQLKNTARKAKRSVLFLGVSPRDPVARQLGQQLLVAEKNRQQGPTYFCWPNADEVDTAYWQKYGVKWLTHDVTTLVRLVTEEMKIA